MLKITPIFTFNGQTSQAIELYEKAFGAEVKVKILYSDAKPEDFKCKDEEKDFIFHSQIKIGDQILILADDSGAILKDGTQGALGKSSLQNLLIDFESDDELDDVVTE